MGEGKLRGIRISQEAEERYITQTDSTCTVSEETNSHNKLSLGAKTSKASEVPAKTSTVLLCEDLPTMGSMRGPSFRRKPLRQASLPYTNLKI